MSGRLLSSLLRRRAFRAPLFVLLAALLLAMSGLLGTSGEAQAQAQTVTLISNVGQGGDDSTSGADPRAQRFTTGSNSTGYTLSSVEIVSEDPQGDDARVSLCTVDGSGYPTSTCTALTAPGSFAAGTLAFTAPSNTTLDANTTYTLLIESPGDEFLWLDSTTSDNEDAGGATGWTIADVFHVRIGGGSWSENSDGESIRIAVKGTVVPPLDEGELVDAHTSPIGMWSPDGDTLWVGQWTSKQVYAYDLSDWAPKTAEQWTLTNPGGGSDNNIKPTGFHSDGTHIWVSDVDHDRVFRYDFSSKSHNDSANLALHSDNGKRQGLWSDGTTAWISDSDDNKLYAYRLTDFSRDSGEDIDLHSDNGEVRGIWSDGRIIWALDRDDEVIYAYDLSDGSREENFDIDLDSEGVNYNSIWSDGTTMYVIENAAGSTRSPQIHRLPMPRTLDPLLLSNTGQTHMSVDSVNNKDWVSQQFTTGPNSAGYTLSSIALSSRLAQATVPMTVTLDEEGSAGPSSTPLATFANPSSWIVGDNVFTLSEPVELDANTSYRVYMVATADINPSATASTNVDSGSQAGWSFGEVCDSDDCFSTFSYQIALRGTVTPYPVLISNTGQPKRVDEDVSDHVWLAQQFTTGSNSLGYTLSSVSVPAGVTGTPTVTMSLRADNGSNRISDTDLVTFTAPTTWVSDGTHVFTLSTPYKLDADTSYWVRMTATADFEVGIGNSYTVDSDSQTGWRWGFACDPDNCYGSAPYQMALRGMVTPSTVPGAPASFTATAGDAQVSLSWAEPSDVGVGAVTMYRHRHRLNSDTDWSSWTEVSAATLTATVTGLTKGSAYDFEVQAKNSEGWGASASASATLPAPPPSGTVLLSIDGQTTEASRNIDNFSWAAQQFTTGSNNTGYTLSSVSVTATFSGTPSVTMSLREDDGSNRPSDTDLATFTLPSSWTSGGANVFTLSTPVELQANTKYWVYMVSTTTFLIPYTASSAVDSNSQPGWGVERSRDSTNSHTDAFYKMILRGTVKPLPPPSGTVLLSNDGLTRADLDNIGSYDWAAQQFTTGSNSDGYTLSSVSVTAIFSGTPSVTVSLRADVSNQPSGTDLATFTPPVCLD